jgi:hypothetical protein
MGSGTLNWQITPANVGGQKPICELGLGEEGGFGFDAATRAQK